MLEADVMTRAKVKPTIFHFLGSRDYVHSTSMLSELIETIHGWGFGEALRINAAFHWELTGNGEFVLLDESKKGSLRDEGYCARFRIHTSIESILVGLRKTGDSIYRSVPYDEDKLIEGFEITLGTTPSALTKIRRTVAPYNALIALMKRLHEAVLPPDVTHRWTLSGFDLKWTGMKAGEERMIMIKLVSGVKGGFTRSSVQVDGSRVGYMLFTRVEGA